MKLSKWKLNAILLTGAILVFGGEGTEAVQGTTFGGWPDLMQGQSSDIMVARCLKTPNPYYREEPDSWDLSFNDITNFAAFAKKLADKSNPVSECLMDRIDHIKPRFPPWELTSTNGNILKSVFPVVLMNLNDLIYGPSIYESNCFRDVKLRPATDDLRKKNPQGEKLEQLNRMLLEDSYPGDIATKRLKPGILQLGPYKDGVIQSSIEVVLVLKGQSSPGISSLVSTYFLPRQGEYYLIFARQYKRKRYTAIEDYRIVPLGMQFNPDDIAGQNFDRQVATLLKQGIWEAKRQIERGQQQKSLLEQAFPPATPATTNQE
jgi:hypothetical protein